MSGGNGTIQLVTSDFLAAEDHPSMQLHLIILNYVLPPQTAHLWKKAVTRICADGGANRLFDQLPGMLPGMDPLAARSSHLPDLIKGDLDSVRSDVTDFYTSRGVPFIDLSSDQETTDLEKCLLFLEGRLRSLSEEAAAMQCTPAAPAAGSAGRDGHRATAAAAVAAARATNGLGHINVSSRINSDQGGDVGAGSSGLAAAQLQVDCSATSTSIGPPTPSSAAADAAAAGGGSTGGSSSSEHVGLSSLLQQRAPLQQDRHAQQQQQQQQAPPIVGEVLLLVEDPQQQLLVAPQSSGGPGGASWLSRLASGARNSGSLPEGSTSSRPAGREVQASTLGSLDAEQANNKRMHQEHVILVLGALGGRLDHTLSNLNTLYCYPHLNIALWGDGNLVRLLRAGQALIRPSRVEGPTCGLVPLARPATASSRGLKWDLDHTHMCFRGLLSTSNIISSDTIEVTTDEDLLWITSVGNTMAPQHRHH